MASIVPTETSQSTVLPTDSISAISSDSSDNTTPLDGSSVARSSRKRKRPSRSRDKVWDYCRTPIPDVEPYCLKEGRRTRRYWYCRYPQCPDYSVLSTIAARHHMATIHGLNIDANSPSIVKGKIQEDLVKLVNRKEQSRRNNEHELVKAGLRKAANPAVIQQALLRLIVHHDLPLSTVEWPELHTLVLAINHQAEGCLWTSHQTTANIVAKTFETRQLQLKQLLQESRSLIHFTTDTWYSPNYKELQAITGHWIDETSRLRKALLALKELDNSHAGVEVAAVIQSTLEHYEIKDKAGYITADNHGANDTLCNALSQVLNDWDPQQRRLRCVGHIINLAVQSFLFAKSKEAVELAITSANSSGLSIDEELLQKSENDDTAGWIKQPALQRILKFVTSLRHSDKLYNAFKRAAGKVIRAPNTTRWNSYYNTLEDALELKGYYTSFIHDNPALAVYELTTADWLLVEQTVAFLEPFKVATKRCEGDYVTLDKVQLYMDGLDAHFKEQQELYKPEPAMLGSIITSWHAFDKYYKVVDTTGAYTAAILLHPALRKSYLTSAWKRDWITAGVQRARALWLQYKQEVSTDNTDTSSLPQFERFLAGVQSKQRSKGGSADEFERFIAAPIEHIDIPPLQWWLQPQQQRSYPQLSQLAIDILSCPAMSAESERVFSGTRRTVPWTRARLSGSTIEQLECTKHWQRAGVIDTEFELIDDVV